MPPSILSSEALVIWMFRIAMNAPIMAAVTEIQTVALARSGAAGATAATGRRGAVEEVESARSDMTSPVISSSSRSLLEREQRDAGGHTRVRHTHSNRQALLGLDGRDHRHARTKLDARSIQRDLDGDALYHLGEVSSGIIRRQQCELLAARGREAVDMAM